MRCEILEFRNVSKIYPNNFTALKNIDLKVEANDICGVIGYSGAGKSTLIRIANLLEHPSSGEVYFEGHNLLQLSAKNLRNVRQKIGMIFQHFNLFSMSAFDNVALSLKIAGWHKVDIKKRVLELLELVGLEDKVNSYPSALSGGQKQRVAIARALANHPSLLLCDEATSALDTKNTHSILSLLREIQKNLGISILLITHQIEVVKNICNKICVINDGEIIENGLVHEVFAHPKKSITKELLGLKESPPPHSMNEKSHFTKVVFEGDSALNPHISTLIKSFDVEVNILSGDIEHLRTKKIGYLLLEIKSSKDEYLKALNFLKNRGVSVEELHV